jgi:hypothetical protein
MAGQRSMLLLGAVLGMVVTPGMVLFPLSRMVRGLTVTARVESDWNPDASGDGGASIGLLQFNDVNADLVPWQGWRTSPLWSGYAAVRYIDRSVQGRDAWRLLAPDADGLAAWRSLWVQGRVQLVPNGADAYPPGVGPLSVATWAEHGPNILWTVGQYLALAVCVAAAPLVMLPYLGIGLVRILARGRR